MRARFLQRLKEAKKEHPIVLKLAVSMSNQRETGEDFLAFIELINRHNEQGIRIKKVKIILSCYLQRHYIGLEAARRLEKRWRDINEDYLKQLQLDEQKKQIIEWEALVEENEQFKDCLVKVQQLYENESEFQTIVNNLARQHSYRADHESAKNYLLEECAVFLNMQGHVSYPSTELNAAINFVLRTFNSTLKFHGYTFYPEPENQAKQHTYIESTDSTSSYQLFKACASTSELMRRRGIFNPEYQAKFFENFLKLEQEYIQLEHSQNNNNQTEEVEHERLGLKQARQIA